MVFYILMLVQLVLIGGAFFLWFKMRNEGAYAVAGMPGVAAGLYEEQGSTHSNYAQPSGETKMPGFGSIEGKDQAAGADEWEKFGVMERKNEKKEDFSDMDEMFGFGENANHNNDSSSFDEFDDFSEPKIKKPSIEEEFAELFTEEELQEDNFGTSISVDDSRESNSDFLNDFELDKSPSFSTEFRHQRNEEEKKQAEDPLNFLRNYQFADSGEEELTDDIFEQARNRKDDFDFGFNQSEDNQNQDDSLIFEDEDDIDIDLMKRTLPPLEGLNHRSEESGIVLEPTPRNEDEEDDIFARFQSLQRMTDNMGDFK